MAMRNIQHLWVAALLLTAASCTNEVKKADSIDPAFVYDDDYFSSSTDTSVTGKSENVSFSSATLVGKINNIRSVQSLPVGSTFGILLSSSDSDPRFGGQDVIEVRSQRKSLVYRCEATGLTMGTLYYYRSFFRQGAGKVYLGRVFAFNTEKCEVETLSPSKVGFCTVTVQGRSSVKLNQTSFKGSYGVLFTDRQTDRPSPEVDQFVSGKVAAGDSVVFDVTLKDLVPAHKYVYQAYLKIDEEYYFGPARSFSTPALAISDSDLPVDLGLSVRWASRNVGAESASVAGTYFGYGDPTGEMMSSDSRDYPSVEIAGTEYDVAAANLGVGWQMPTFEQFKELAEECDWLWTTFNDAQGYAVMSRVDGNAIFLPACGYSMPTADGRVPMGYDMAEPQGFYWSGSKAASSSSKAYSLHFTSKDHDVYSLGDKCRGYCVRPVAE